MGIPEMITHPSSQDPGGFWENMKAGMICCQPCSQGFKGRNSGNAWNLPEVVNHGVNSHMNGEKYIIKAAKKVTCEY